jgi:hypothetical protein
LRSFLSLVVLAFIFTGCASGHCVSLKKETLQAKDNSVKVEHVKVYKYDGSLQCGMGKAISLDDMKKELGDIVVFSAENKYDGLMHIQACGTITGKANVYEIDKTDLEKALKLGFKFWTFDEPPAKDPAKK